MSREGYRKRLSLAFPQGRPLITPLGYFPHGFILGASASALSMDTKQPRALVVPGATVWLRKPWPIRNPNIQGLHTPTVLKLCFKDPPWCPTGGRGMK